MDATLYAKYLRKLSTGHGVQRIEGKIAEVLRHPDGDVAALKLADGSLLEADLFVDCTGMRALLLGDTLGVKLEDWTHWLPCDRALVRAADAIRAPGRALRAIDRAPVRMAVARSLLQHRVGNGMVLQQLATSATTMALATLLKNVQGEVLTKPRVIPFKACQRETVWERNCVAIGLSSGFLEPLESTSIHLIQRGVIRLLQLFPNQGVRQADVDEYNKRTAAEMEHIRDFIILHYKVTNRTDSDFWNHVRTMAVPASLQHRIDLFRESGHVFRIPNELFAENSWIQVMLGQGIMPQQHHHIANLMDDRELNGFLEEIRGRVERTVAQLPPHADYVARYCARLGRARQAHARGRLTTAKSRRALRPKKLCYTHGLMGGVASAGRASRSAMRRSGVRSSSSPPISTYSTGLVAGFSFTAIYRKLLGFFGFNGWAPCHIPCPSACPKRWKRPCRGRPASPLRRHGNAVS